MLYRTTTFLLLLLFLASLVKNSFPSRFFGWIWNSETKNRSDIDTDTDIEIHKE